MVSATRLASLGALIAALIVTVPGISIAAGMGMGSVGAMGSAGTMGGMANTMMGPPASSTGAPISNSTTDPSLRNISRTGLSIPMSVSKAWQDVPLSDPGVVGALVPVPTMPVTSGSAH
jgi:hypothetical protein